MINHKEERESGLYIGEKAIQKKLSLKKPRYWTCQKRTLSQLFWIYQRKETKQKYENDVSLSYQIENINKETEIIKRTK